MVDRRPMYRARPPLRRPTALQRAAGRFALAVLLALMLLVALAVFAHEEGERLEILGCYDGDTCRGDVHLGLDAALLDQPLRLVGFDTPEIRGDCEQERKRAIFARDRLLELVRDAEEVRGLLYGRDRYGRVLTRLMVDGTDVGDVLIGESLARPYAGGRREGWCSAEEGG